MTVVLEVRDKDGVVVMERHDSVEAARISVAEQRPRWLNQYGDDLQYDIFGHDDIQVGYRRDLRPQILHVVEPGQVIALGWLDNGKAKTFLSLVFDDEGRVQVRQ